MIQKESEYWNVVGRTWDDGQRDRLWRKHSDAVNSVWLRRWLPEGRVDWILKTDAFDEACSEGLFELLQLHGNRVVEMDVSTATLAAARGRYPVLRGVVTDARTLPFASGVFDVIVSNSTLDHFRTASELKESLCELYRILKPGGSLLLSLDNLWNPVIAVRNLLPFRLLHSIGLLPYFVGVTFGPRRLRRELEAIGFDVCEVTALLHCPRVTAVRQARRIQTLGNPEEQGHFLSQMLRYERLASWPTRFLTGHFVAARAIKRSN